MRKRKLDPKIIRIGDVVCIDNPEMFIRCGYPLSLDDACKEVEEKFGRVIEDLIHSVQCLDEFVPADEKGVYQDGSMWPTCVKIPSLDRNKQYSDLVKTLTYYRLVGKNFGGNERKIFTQLEEGLRGRKASVVGIEFVKTGIRHPASGGYDYYSGGYEYEPPYLENEKTHKILDLHVNVSDTNEWCAFLDLNRIEVVNVTKIHSKEEVESVCGIIDALEVSVK